MDNKHWSPHTYWEHLLSLQYQGPEIKGHLQVWKSIGKEMSAWRVRLIASTKYEGFALVM